MLVGDGINRFRSDWFVSFIPLGFGFWLDMYLDHENTQDLDEWANGGDALVGLHLIIIAFLTGGWGILLDILWIVVAFIMGDMISQMQDTDEGRGIHLYWKHWLAPIGIYNDEIILEPQ